MTEPNPRPRNGLIVLLSRPWVWLAVVVIAVAAAFTLSVLRPRLAAPTASRSLSMTEGLSTRAPEWPASGFAAREAAAPPETKDHGGLALARQRKVISTANLEIKVKSASQAADDLARLAAGAGGFVQSSSMSVVGADGRMAEMVLRVPAERFEAFLTTVGGLGKVLRREINGQDVTEEYVDNQARLRAWESEERQLYAIMARAKTVGEVLAVRDRLSQVRETIEQIQGRLKYYDYNVALATISVSLREGDRPVSPPWILQELAGLGRALYGSLRSLILVLLVLIPWGLAGWGLWRIGRRILKKSSP